MLKPFVIAALLYSFTANAPALARDWGNVGGWHVTAGTNSCGLYTDDRGGLINVGGTEIVFLRRADGGVYLQASNLGWSLPRLDENQIFFEIDGERYFGPANIAALPADPARGFLAALDDGFEAAMRRGRRLDIGLNAAKIAQISLQGSTAALTTLDQCLAELRADAPASPRFPPLTNVAAKPIGSPASWIEASDYPRDFDARALQSGGGTTRFKLTVGTDGRALDCTVTQSSGLANLDKATCRAMMRNARFVPAADAPGNAAAGSYENKVVWKAP